MSCFTARVIFDSFSWHFMGLLNSLGIHLGIWVFIYLSQKYLLLGLPSLLNVISFTVVNDRPSWFSCQLIVQSHAFLKSPSANIYSFCSNILEACRLCYHSTWNGVIDHLAWRNTFIHYHTSCYTNKDKTQKMLSSVHLWQSYFCLLF